MIEDAVHPSELTKISNFNLSGAVLAAKSGSLRRPNSLCKLCTLGEK